MFVIDNTVLSNFAKVKNISLLKNILVEAVITEQVLEEFNFGIGRGIIPKVELPFKVVKLTEEERQLYQKLRTNLGKGEASSIAVGKFRGAIFLSDDWDARKTAYLLELKVAGTVGVLVLGVKKGVLTIEDGNLLLREMIRRGFYSPVEDLGELR